MGKRNLIIGLIAILLFGLYFAWDIIADQVSGIIGEAFKDKEWRGISYKTWVLISIPIIAVIIGILYRLQESLKKRISEKDSKTGLAVARSELIEGTRKRYERRRKSKLNNDLTFELDLILKYKETKTQDPVHRSFLIKPEKTSIADYDEFFRIFNQKVKRLLILGSPGSGKTLLLLRLAEYLIEKAKEDPKHPVPIIINLAGWRSSENSFASWMENQLPFSAGEGGISKEYAGQLIAAHQILPLLDGLDEIPEDHRASVLTTLEDYLRNRQNQLGREHDYPEVVICSRIAEFEAIEAAAAPVFATVEIQPLTQKAVRESLEQLEAWQNIAAASLLSDLKNHSSFRQALNTAFYVHTALSLSASKKEIRNQFLSQDSPEVVQEELIQTYIGQELDKLMKVGKYPSAKPRLWLAWLANRLAKSRKGVTFELADLQPSWLGGGKKNMFLYWLVFGLVGGLVEGLVVYLVFGPVGGLVGGLVVYLVLGLVGGLVGGLVLGLVLGRYYITYNDIVKLNWRKLMPSAFLRILVLGLVFGLVFGLVGGLVFGLVFGLVLGLVFGLVFGLVIGLVEELEEDTRFPQITHPFQRIAAGVFRNAVSNIVAFAVIFSALKFQSVSQELKEALDLFSYSQLGLVALILGPLVSFLLSPFYWFSILYFLLKIRDFIPLRYVNFLNNVANHTGLMERDGGQWRFRHQLIQDTLEKEWEAADFSDSKPD